MLRAFLLIALLGCTSAAHAQSVKSDPLPLAHPQTGEPGVWVPLWFQQDILHTDASLRACAEARATVDLQLTETEGALHQVYASATDLQKAVDALKAKAALELSLRERADARADRRLYWALTATGAAVVAVLVAVVPRL